MKLNKKILASVLALVMLVTCFNATAFAAENVETDAIESISSDDSIVSVTATVPGVSIATGETSYFYYNDSVTLTVPSGHTAHYVGVLVADRTDYSTGATFNVTPAWVSAGTVTADGSFHFYTLTSSISGGSSVTYTITLKSGDITHQYQAVFILYE